MKTKKVLFYGFVFVLISFFMVPLSAAKKVEVEGVRINKKSSTGWAVIGKIRNLENSPIKGYVKIKFLDSNGDIVKTYTAFVNGGDPLKPGQAGPFEYWTDPDDFDGVVDFQVIFVSR